MTRLQRLGTAALAASVLWSAESVLWSAEMAAAVEVQNTPAVPAPVPTRSPGSGAPLLPPAGLPTAPPPDAIKPVEPQAAPIQPKVEPMGAPADADVAFRYVAVIPGECERLEVAGRELTDGCIGKLVNVDFGDGRVTFVFTRPSPEGIVLTAFTGHASHQDHRRSYQLQVDQVRTTITDRDGRPASVAIPVKGRCAMTGDPLAERALFECTVEDGAERTQAVFRSAGTPAVYAGARRGRPDDAFATADPTS